MNNILKKLSTHELPIDNSFWEDMEGRLHKQKRRKFMPYWWIASGIAAAIALLLMMNLNFESQEILEQRVKSKEQRAKNKDSFFSDEQKPLLAKVEQRAMLRLRSATENQEQRQSVPKNEQENIPNKVAPAPLPIGEGLGEGLTNQQQTNQPINKSTNQQINSSKNKSTKISANMRLGGQTSGGNNASNTLMQQDYNNKNSDYTTGLRNTEADYSLADLLDQYPETRYMPPISAGVSVRKYLTNRIALETGLFYTYLQTDFVHNNNDWIQEKAKLKMHYLGIPLNVTVDIVKKPKWNLYGSAGCAVEKGLWLTYHKKTTYPYYPEFSRDEHLGEKIKRIQMSITAAMGVDVTIVKNFSIYFEPRVGYYFRNMQPLSIRTASPLNIELNAGLRMTIN